MNLLAAMALLVIAGDETAAFWSLTTIIQRVIPGYHCEGLELLRLDIRVVASMLEQRDPALLMHLTTLGVFDVVVTKWLSQTKIGSALLAAILISTTNPFWRPALEAGVAKTMIVATKVVKNEIGG